jgi:hypothetical protein
VVRAWAWAWAWAWAGRKVNESSTQEVMSRSRC